MTTHHALSSVPKKILLPIDFSASSQTALAMAADLAKHFHAELVLVNVISVFPTTTMPDMMPETEVVEKARASAERHLAKCQSVLADRGVTSASYVEAGNDVAGEIMALVDRAHIDMVVISTHGISGRHPLVFGSIAEKAVKLVQCPLLLLRSTKPDEEQSSATDRTSEWW